MIRSALLALAVVLAAGCDGAEDAAPTSVRFTFETGAEGWAAGFADYSEGMEESIGFISEHRPAPADFAASDGALYLRGANVSDDLKLYAKRRVDGLAPSTVYEITGEVEIGSSAGVGCVGAGGSPGESVVLKVGASATEPQTVRSNDPAAADFVLSIDVGGQNLTSRGPDGLSIGDLAVAEASCTGDTFFPKTLRLQPGALTARTDVDGRLWLLVSTDSGFEGINRYYLDTVTLTLTP